MIYVDTLINYGWKLGPSCHLLADNEEELHSFAQKIGMRREWFQPGGKHALPHYDLTAGRRAAAVSKGAIEIDRKQLYAMIQKAKRKLCEECKTEGASIRFSTRDICGKCYDKQFKQADGKP